MDARDQKHQTTYSISGKINETWIPIPQIFSRVFPDKL